MIARSPGMDPKDALEKFNSVPGFILGDINLDGIVGTDNPIG